MALTDPSSPTDHDADRPQGSLEDLFRHHLAHAEAPPRPMLWEQIDTALLVRQNETYRRRLAATRWVAAASLLVATLAGGAGWWAQQASPKGNVAATTPSAPASRNRAAEQPTAGAPGASQAAGTALASRAGSANVGATPDRLTAEQPLGAANQTTYAASPNGRSAGYAAYGIPEAGTGSSAASFGFQALARGNGEQGARGAAFGTPSAASGAAFVNSATGQRGATYRTAMNAYGAAGPGTAAQGPGYAAAGWDALAQRPAALAGGLPAAALPARLAAVAVVPNVAAAPLKRWQFGVSVASGVFSPNADFSQEGSAAPTANIPYSVAASTNAVALANRSAAEYRQYLHGGLDQRVAVRATRLLGGRWALRTGLELGQHEAQSATSTSFVGEQLPTYYAYNTAASVAAPAPTLRTTSFRYRTVGVPVAVHYANPAKRGWSGYGHLGAVVGALLSVRSEVAGEPEAAQDYPLAAAGSPYRRLLTTLRGGAGVQYRAAAGRWTVSAGPTAEIGVLSLNAQPVQDFVNQRRPYSVGLEAAVDFGGTVKMP
ncbi:MAG: hypothetical protein ACRYFR_07740 [Janthinobacterium lividum]